LIVPISHTNFPLFSDDIFFRAPSKGFFQLPLLRLLDRKPFRKAKLPTSSGLLRCVTDSYRLEIYNFTGSLNCSRALSAGPGSAFGVAKSIEHTTAEAAQDVAHQVECCFIDEIGTMYRRAINFAREKARAIERPRHCRLARTDLPAAVDSKAQCGSGVACRSV
jgi:hypothetical protein